MMYRAAGHPDPNQHKASFNVTYQLYRPLMPSIVSIKADLATINIDKISPDPSSNSAHAGSITQFGVEQKPNVTVHRDFS